MLKNKSKASIFFLILVAVLGISGTGYILVKAQSVGDDFSTADYIADTWNTMVATSTEEVLRLSERSCDDSTWICNADDVCENELGDGDYIIVAKTDLGSQYEWKENNTSCVLPHCEGDHLVADNTIDFMAPKEYPARDACKAMGGRLPTENELSCIYNYRGTFGDNFQDDWYWSASESGTLHARRVRLSDGDTNSPRKDNSAYVRCVRGW